MPVTSEPKLSFNPEYCYNEREVESKLLVNYLLPILGYSPAFWHQQVHQHRFRLDFLAQASHSLDTLSVVMEAKHPRVNLNEHVKQLSDYLLTDTQLKYGLLTNGREIRIYERQGSSVQFVFQCFGYGIEHKVEEIRALIGRKELSERLSEPVNKPGEGNTLAERTTTEETRTMKIIAVYHNKGGVGKTTTVVNLAAALSEMGKKVLVIDLDSQANTTFATGLVNFGDEEKDTLKDNYVYHLLKSSDYNSVPETARTARFSSHPIDVIPSHIHLMKEEKDLNQLTFSKVILIQKLGAVKDRYEIVLIDTPPSMNLYAELALIAADYLIIPSDLKPFANEGLENVKGFIKGVDGFRKFIHQAPLQILGVLPSKISTNARFVQSTLPKRLAQITQRYQLEVTQSIIFEREDLAKCTEQTLLQGEVEIPDPRSVLDFASHSKSAEEFRTLAKEVLQKVGKSS